MDSAFAREVSGPEEFPGQAASSTRLAVTGIDHVAINVPDIDAAAGFFADLLGARIVSDMHPGKIPNAWEQAFNWNRSSEFDRIVMMHLRDGSQIGLF